MGRPMTRKGEKPGPGSPSSEPEPSYLQVMGAGLELAGVIAVLVLAGHWLDGRWGTGPWLTLAGLAFGLVGGVYRLWRIGQRYFNAPLRHDADKESDD